MVGELTEEQIKKTAAVLALPAEFIRKDYYVTQALHALTHVHDDHFGLVFQGGTSLSKGYHAVHRLSEDIDFRVILKPNTLSLGKNIRRNLLRDFRHKLVKALVVTGFSVLEEKIQVFYEGRFMRIQAEFEGSKHLPYLKPHIAIECFVGELLLDFQFINVTSLIKVTLEDECQHLIFPVATVALDETAAEKWVALTRRVAGTQEKVRPDDKQLVRHLYDLFQLHHQKLLTGEYVKIINKIIQKDRLMFKGKSSAYTQNPFHLSMQALDLLEQDHVWQKHWDVFIEQMVYESNPPTFSHAVHQLRIFSEGIIEQFATDVTLS